MCLNKGQEKTPLSNTAQSEDIGKRRKKKTREVDPSARSRPEGGLLRTVAVFGGEKQTRESIELRNLSFRTPKKKESRLCAAFEVQKIKGRGGGEVFLGGNGEQISLQ